MKAVRVRGFTLIELMVVVAVIAILAVIAIPSYIAQTRKSRRGAAISAMNTVVLNEERWRTNCPLYADLGEAAATNCPTAGAAFMAAPASNYYTYTVPTHTASQYVIQAVALGSQAKDKQFGTSCTTLSICANITATAPCTVLRSPAVCFGQ